MRINLWPYVYGVIAAVLAMVLLNWFRKGWHYVLESWWQYPLVVFVAIVAVAGALALTLTATGSHESR